MRASPLLAGAARAPTAAGTVPPHAPPAALPSMAGHNAQPVATSWSSHSRPDGGKAPRGDGINALFARPSTGTPPSSIYAAFHDEATGHQGLPRPGEHAARRWTWCEACSAAQTRPIAFPVRQPRTDALRRLSSSGHRDDIWRLLPGRRRTRGLAVRCARPGTTTRGAGSRAPGRVSEMIGKFSVGVESELLTTSPVKGTAHRQQASQRLPSPSLPSPLPPIPGCASPGNPSCGRVANPRGGRACTTSKPRRQKAIGVSSPLRTTSPGTVCVPSPLSETSHPSLSWARRRVCCLDLACHRPRRSVRPPAW